MTAWGGADVPGRHYEQWRLGDTIRHQPHRTVTETDNLLISALTHNPQPLHLDETYAEGTEFGRIVVNGTFTFSLLVGLSVGDTTLGTLVATRCAPKPRWSASRIRARGPRPASSPSSTACSTSATNWSA